MPASTVFDDFEDNDVNEWSINWASGNFYTASTNTPHQGSYHAICDSEFTDRPELVASRTMISGGAQITEFTFYYKEDSGSTGGGIRLVDSSGNYIAAWVTDNPQWKLTNGSSFEQIHDGNGNYQDYHEVDVTFDWSAGTYDVTWTNLATGYSETHTGKSLNNTTDVETVEIVNVAQPSSISNLGGQSSNLTWYDEIRYTDQPPLGTPSISVSSVSGDTVNLSWTDVDSEDGYRVYRAESSGTTTADYTQIADIAAGSTSYADSAAKEDGEKFFYRVESYNSSETKLSNEVNATTDLPAPSVSIDTSIEDEVTLDITKNDDSSDGEFEVFRSQDGSLGTKIADGLATTTSSYTDTGLEDGEEFYYTLRRITDHVSTDSSQQSAITLLPAASITNVDTATEDQITVDYSLNDDSDDGDFLVWLNPSPGMPYTDGDSEFIVNTAGTGNDDNTNPSLTGSGTLGGLRDGEKYYVSHMRRTPHTSTEVRDDDSGVTVLPAPTQLAVDAVGAGSVDLSWVDNHDYGDTRVEYKRSSDGSWTTFSSVVIGTQTETITGLLNGEQYDARVVAQTEHTTTEDV